MLVILHLFPVFMFTFMIRIAVTNDIMKKMSLFSALILFGSLSMRAQKAISFENLQTAGLSLAELDSVYRNAVHSDPAKAVFGGQEELFTKSYAEMLRAFNQYLHEHQFQWGKDMRCFNRVYFDADGRIAYFLYSFRNAEIVPEKAKQFDTLLNEFIKSYVFPLKATVKFSQCSPTIYKD